jgi:hypothetical protein
MWLSIPHNGYASPIHYWVYLLLWIAVEWVSG